MELEIKNISKNYGRHTVLNNVSLTLERGVYGLLGPNGAGKSTLIQIITGNLSADGGQVFYNGIPTSKSETAFKKILGYVPQNQGLYDAFTARKFLEYMAVLKALPKKDIPQQIHQVLEVVGLLDVQDRRLGSFSGGMCQRILIAQALLGSPEVIILDEPTAGLDPKERIKIRNFISRISENKIIILATHVVSDVESIAREIILLGDGQIRLKGTPGQLCATINGRVFECIIDTRNMDMLEEKFIISNLQEMPDNRLCVRILGDDASIDSIRGQLKHIEPVFPNLQEVYLDMFDQRQVIG